MFFFNNNRLFIKKILSFVLILFCCVLIFNLAELKPAEANDININSQLKNFSNQIVGDQTNSPKLTELISKIANYLASFLSLIFLVMIIYHGLNYMVSRGNKQTIENSVNSIKAAFIGLIIIFLSYIIVQAILFLIAEVFANQPN